MGLKKENRFQVMLYDLAKSLATVNNITWDKVKILVSYCPQISDDHFIIYPYSLDCIIALGIFYIESKFCHTEKIVPYLLNLLKGLTSAKWFEENEHSEVPYPERFAFCLNTLLSQISIDIKKDIFVYQSNEIENIYSNIVSDLRNGFNNPVQEQIFFCVKLPVFLGLAQSMVRYNEQERSYFCYLFPNNKAYVGVIHRIKTNYESPHINLVSLICKQAYHTGSKSCSHTFVRKCCDYPLESILNIVEVVHSLLSENILKQLEESLIKFSERPSTISFFYYKNFVEILKCATMILYQDVLYQQSNLTDYVVKDFVDTIYTSVHCYDSMKPVDPKIIDNEELVYEKLKINVLTKATCLELLAWTVKDVYDSETLCVHVTSLLKYKQKDNKILVINTPMTICCMKVLGMLAEKFPTISDVCIKAIQEFLSSPSYTLINLCKNTCLSSKEDMHMKDDRSVSKAAWYGYCIFKKVQNIAIESLCMSLKSVHQLNENYIPAFLTKFSSLLFMEKGHPQYALIIENVVASLGHISYSIPAFSLTILQCFQQRLCRHSVESDIAIIHQLGNMLICNQNMEMFLGALKTFSNIMLDLNGNSKKESEHISNNLFHVLVNVADRLQEQPKIIAVFIKFLEMFVQAGLDELRNPYSSVDQQNETAKTSQENLLRIIALLSTKLQPNTNFKKQQERLFQDFWIYYVLRKESLILDSVCDPYLKVIAPKLPTLTSESLTDHDLREFFYSSSLNKIKVPPTKLNVLKTQLLNFLHNTSDIVLLVNKLSFSQLMYLHSVSALEIIRIEHSEETSIEPLFSYLTNMKLQKDKYGIWQCIYKVADEIFKRFLKTLSNKIRDSARESILENHAHMLLIYFNNINPQIRHIADKFLSELIESFPHLLWSRQVLWSMLDIVSALHQSLIIDSNDQITSLSVPNSNYLICLMDTKKAREEIFSDFVARSREIISEARKWAPNIINSHFQQYVVQEGHLFPKMDPVCHLRHTAWMLLCASEKSYLEISDVISSLTVKSRFIGEVIGLMEKSNLSAYEFGKNLSDEVWEACTNKNLTDYQICLQRATAFAVTQTSLQYEIKRVLASSHIIFFSEETVSTAIHCWYWMCTAHPDFELEFLMEMFAAWQYTIDNRIGLYLGKISKDKKASDIEHVHSDPHNIWAEFIVQQISCSKYSCQNKLEMIIGFLNNILPMSIGSKECIMKRNVESIIARFSILSASLSLLQSDITISCLEKLIVRQKIYCSCLDFFCSSRKFPRKNGFYLKRSIDVLVKFWHALYSDKKHLLKTLPTNEPQKNISSVSECLTIMTEKQNNKCSLKVTSADYLVLFNSFSSDFLKKRKLALCLLAEEIEFLLTWHDPRFSIETDKIREWQSNFFMPNRSMSEFTKTAWDISPILAVYLPIRLRRDNRLWDEVSRIILLNPSSVSHIPHAMMFLATAENVQKDCKELIHLLTWTKAKPLLAMNLLSLKSLLNSLVFQYVLKMLLKCNPNNLTFYIPQLVQSLRYDKFGYLYELLFTLSSRSPLFCHQLIWNMKTNMYNDINMSSKTQIFEKLNYLLNNIINNLNELEKAFFNREFDFVDQITEISYRIPRNLKGEERKNACLKGLKMIKLKPGCYLPSSPDALICDIDYNSGTPLQSKARTPYLANFLVYRCTYDQVHEIGMQVSAKQLSGTSFEQISNIDVNIGPKTWQRTIFKAADDVRQDILALQTIQYLKNIFQDIGLDVFLFPYKVVAVAPGMGVIECIPNAHSRDQLGKQTNVGLYDYFVSTFGDEKSQRFQEAQRNFIKSVAAYSLVIFLLQIKDRHNGNIMVDDVGHIIHIDFGFMFESSPGGNLGFEPDMKLTEEMVMIMGGRTESEPFQWFTELCVKAYLALRCHQENIITLVTLMLDSGFPCFRGHTIKLLRGRFAPNASDREAADYIMTVIRNSCLNFRTVTYDMLQYLQNSIQY